MRSTTTENRTAGALRGALAGLIATAPMTVVMLAWHRRLPSRHRYALPPRLITDGIAEHVLDGRPSEPAGTLRALAAHFAFGTAAGSAYSFIRKPATDRRPVVAGTAYGLLVWAISYLGWVPVAGLMPPATREPAGRNLMMIAAHVVWGAALGIVLHTVRARAPRRNWKTP